MSHMECVPGGVVPAHNGFVYGGARHIYVLVSRADRRKDWQEKVNPGYYVEYSDDSKSWGVYIPSTESAVLSAHVLFDEKIPSTQSDYFREIDKMVVKFALDEIRLEREWIWYILPRSSNIL